jgi:hypothetical protein
MWCGGCYTSTETPRFHIADATGSNGELNDEDRIQSGWKPRKGEATRFREARNGDDLLLSFECKTCIFSKLYRRLPFEGNNTETDGFAMG